MTNGSQADQSQGQSPQQGPGSDLLLDKRYRIVRLLGEGGMGSVYLAEHVRLRTQVAVKFLHVELTGQEEAIRRFEQEARVAASIRHQNIIQVFDVGFADTGDPFLVMEYLEGESLAGLIKRAAPLTIATSCGIIEPALSALAAAHRKNIIHRDLKPENVFLVQQPDGPPVVKLIDFGLSKITTGVPDQLRTQTGSVLGTPAYMSPEQARGSANLDQRTDLYSLGTILFEMLTGGLPYAGSNFNEFFANLLMEEPRAPKEVCPTFPEEAEPLVRKAICKNPDERFQSATEMLEALATLPGFDRRSEALMKVSAGLSKSSFAGGDLGPQEAQQFGSTILKAAPSNVRRPTTIEQPQNRAETTMPARRRRRLPIGIAVAASALIVGALGAAMRNSKTDAGAPSPSAGPVSKPAEPHRAPPELPKELPKKDPEKVPLPAPAEEAEKQAPPRVPERPTAEATAASPETKSRVRKKARSGSKRLQRGARGTEMSEQFE